MDIQLQSTPGPLASAITGAADSLGGDVPNGGTTADTILTLSGTGTPNTVVYIFDNQTLLRTASVTLEGTWAFTATVELGRHAFTVRDALAGGDSAEWVINVAEAELDLKPPTVAQAPGGTLNPMDAISGATVVVSYDDMQTTDTIGLSWNGLDNLVQPQPGSTIGSVTFTVPASAVAAVIGKTIPVLYAVVRNGVAKPSWELPLIVQTLSESVLEAPRILQASDDLNLDVSALTGDADLRVKPWPFIEAGQLISLRFEGTKADEAAYNWAHPTWQDLPIGSTGEQGTTVALGDLKELKDGSSLTLIFEVSFDGGITTAQFPVRVLSVIQLASGFEGFESASLGEFVEISLPSGLTLLSGVPPVPPYFLGAIVRSASQQGEYGFQYLSIKTTGYHRATVILILPNASKVVRFTLWVVSTSRDTSCIVSFYNALFETIFAQRVTLIMGHKVLVECVAPPGESVAKFHVGPQGYENMNTDIACDNIGWSE